MAEGGFNVGGGGGGSSSSKSSGGTGGFNVGASTAAPKTRKATPPAQTLARLAAKIGALDKRALRGTSEEMVNAQVGEAIGGFSRKNIAKLAAKAKLNPEQTQALLAAQRQARKPREAASLGQIVTGAAGTGLELLNAPGQAVLGAASEGPGGAYRGFTGEETYTPVQTAYRLTGKSEKEAARAEARLPGLVRGTANFAGAVATDPTTYLSFGTSTIAKEAAKSAAQRVATTTAQDILERGAKRALGERAYRELPRGLKKPLRGAEGGIKVAGRTVVPGRVFAGGRAKAAFDRVVSEGTLLGRLERDVRTLPGVRQGVRSGEFAPEVVGQLEALNRQALAGSRSLSEQDLSRVLPFVHKITNDESWLNVTRALENPANAARLSREERDLFDVLGQLRQEGTLAQQEAGLPAMLREGTESYFPRMKELAGSRAGGAPPMNLSRTLAPNLRVRDEELRALPVEEVDRLLRAQGKSGFELNPAVAGLRRKALANRDVAKVKWVQGLREIGNKEGVPLIQTVDDFGPEIARDIDNLNVGTVYKGNVVKTVPITTADEAGNLITEQARVLVHPALAHDPAFDRVIKVFSDPDGMEEVSKLVEKGMGLWKSYATTLGPFAGGFATRNFQGNLINGYWLTGTNPVWNVRAARLVRGLHKSVEDGTVAEFLARNPRVKDALDNGVIGTGFQHADLGGSGYLEGIKDIGKTSRARRALKSANPLSPNFAPLRIGRDVNTFVEDSSRLGLFLAKRKAGFTNESSSAIVDKFLFNYSDLSKFDEATKKYVIPFWTWTRKNLPLQLETLAKQPGKITAQLHAIQGLQSGLGPENDPLAVSEWMKGAGAVTTGNTAIVPDLPINSVTDQAAPLRDIAQIATTKGPDRWQQLFRDLAVATQPGGPLGGGASGLIQAGSGQELFSGRRFQQGENRLGIPAPLEFMLEQALPVGPGLAKIRGLAEPGSRGRTKRALGGFTGLQTYPLNKKTRRNEMYRRYYFLQELAAYLKSRGVEFPETSSSGSSTGGFKVGK